VIHKTVDAKKSMGQEALMRCTGLKGMHKKVWDKSPNKITGCF